ncbi:unnamed protein product [Absidia cylindrospora]
MSKKPWNPYLLFVVFTITLGALQYGYHTGELNTPQDVISKCRLKNGLSLPTSSSSFELPKCLPMTDARYSLVVAMLLAGGLIGALSASYVSDRYGRRRALIYTNISLVIGSLIMTLAPNVALLMVGRFFAGVGGGLVTVVVPAYISECVQNQVVGFLAL